MKLLVRSYLTSAAAFALASCSPPEIKIALIQMNGHQVVSLTQDWGIIFSDKRVPCVDRIDLHPNDSSRSSVWRVEARTDQCVKLGSFVLGQVPSGFREVIPLPTSSHGTFTIEVLGIGVGWTQLTLR